MLHKHTCMYNICEMSSYTRTQCYVASYLDGVSCATTYILPANMY